MTEEREKTSTEKLTASVSRARIGSGVQLDLDEESATVFISGTYEDIGELREQVGPFIEQVGPFVHRLKELGKESVNVVTIRDLVQKVGIPLRDADTDQVTNCLVTLTYTGLRDANAEELVDYKVMDPDLEEWLRSLELQLETWIVPKPRLHFPPELPKDVDDTERLIHVLEKRIKQLEAYIESLTTVEQQYELLDSLHRKLTPDYLTDTLGPYLAAIAEIQNIINEIQGKEHREVIIESIVQQSPISVSLDGASQAVQVVTDTVVPWRRKHAQEMARLATLEKQAEIESKKAEILEKRARAAKDRAEAGRLAAEAAKQREEAERMKLENEKLRVELHRAKIQLALDILAQVAPNLPETEKIAYTVRLLAPLDTIAFSELEISTGK